jgi:hypothetical protein
VNKYENTPENRIAISRFKPYRVYINWSDNKLDEYSINFVTNVYNKVKKYTSEYCFPNFIDYDIKDYIVLFN